MWRPAPDATARGSRRRGAPPPLAPLPDPGRNPGIQRPNAAAQTACTGDPSSVRSIKPHAVVRYKKCGHTGIACRRSPGSRPMRTQALGWFAVNFQALSSSACTSSCASAGSQRHRQAGLDLNMHNTRCGWLPPQHLDKCCRQSAQVGHHRLKGARAQSRSGAALLRACGPRVPPCGAGAERRQAPACASRACRRRNVGNTSAVHHAHVATHDLARRLQSG
jgi:hypothetical protein